MVKSATLLTAMTAELRGRVLLDLFSRLNSRAGLAWAESSETLPMAAIVIK